MSRSKQKGSSLIFALILVFILSVMASSLMFISQSETWSSMNYRMMTQARYAAEGGLHATANYLAWTYTPPGGAGDPMTAYTYNVSPVAYGGNPVILSTMSGVNSNYPVGSVKTAFNSASSGQMMAGGNTLNYSASAQLVSMRSVLHCGNAQPLTAMVWKITAHGDVTGVRNGEEEVTAILEQQIVPCYNYAAFATSSGCGAINWSGGGPIDSYDSKNVAAGTQNYDGNLGSNGNISTAPHTVINGTYSSPLAGVGACSAGDALTGSLTQVTGCETSTVGCGAPMIQLPQTVIFPTPAISWPLGTVVSALPTTSNGTISPGSYGNLSLHGHDTLTLLPSVDALGNCSGGTYNIESLNMAGANTSIVVGPCPVGSIPAGTYQPLIINIVGVDGSGNPVASPVSLSGNSITNPSLDPRMFQIQYAGTGSISVSGNSQAAGLVYAPNAPVTLSGANSAWYGSLIGNTITMNGNGAAVHYDRRLAADLFTVGNWTLDSFTWSKY